MLLPLLPWQKGKKYAPPEIYYLEASAFLVNDELEWKYAGCADAIFSRFLFFPCHKRIQGKDNRFQVGSWFWFVGVF